MKLGVISALLGLVALMAVSCQDDQSIEFKRYYAAGSLLYQSRCQNCHGQEGVGLAGLIPPLTDHDFIQKNLHRLPCLIKNGLKGEVTINKRSFDGQMLPNDLSPMELAYVITYIANSFDNKAGLLTVDQTNEDLAQCNDRK